MDSVFDAYLKSYAKNRAEEVSESPKINFVSVDFAIDAFEKGKEAGVENFKEKIQNDTKKRINNQIDSTLETVNQLISIFSEKKYSLHKLFLAINSDSSKILFTLPENEHYSDEFMNMFYPLTHELEQAAKGFHLNIYAIDETDNINTELLKCDGYNFCYDIKNSKKIF